MFDSNPKKLRSRILAAFMRRSRWDAPSLLEQVSKSGRCSLAGIYKELGVLTRAGMVIKSGTSWHLSISWTLELSSLSERLRESAMSREGIAQSIECACDEPQSWKFSDLRSMDSFWVLLMFALFDRSGERQLYEIVPRLWFPLADLNLDQRYERGMLTKGNRIFLASAGSSKLEEALIKRWDNSSYTAVRLGVPRHLRPKSYLCAIDDWTIEVSIRISMQREIDRFFLQERILSEDVYRRFRGILSQRTSARIRLSVNSTLAAQIKKEVSAAFSEKAA